MFVGIDLGSRAIKVAALENGRLVDFQIVESGFDPRAQALAMVEGYRPQKVVATGYGRHLAREHFAHEVITEIKAHALGARCFYPDCRTVLDVGGQDCKVISLNDAGGVASFRMNDKCAAGTGRFLEIMATSLGYSLAEFGEAALAAEDGVTITSMCTVFAESEVISLKNRGTPPAAIARAVHLSVLDRLAAMLTRACHNGAVVFSGGVARNPFIGKELEARLGIAIQTPVPPDIVGALGAALHGEKGERG
ncbi:MAG: acyl-CoA dehydratase activase [Desulfobacteraceae bacterium]|nr:acyl-CoA dehydratase activase [Desulfobacteraceae bacterium]